MLSKEILVSLLDYTYQADELLVSHIARLPPDYQHRQSSISLGTVFELLRHMLDTEWSWRLFASGSAGTSYIWEVEDVSDLAALARVWRAERERMLLWIASLSEADLAQEVDFGTAQGGSPQYASVWQIMLHLANHSTHHRSELNRDLAANGYPLDEHLLDYGSFVGRQRRLG